MDFFRSIWNKKGAKKRGNGSSETLDFTVDNIDCNGCARNLEKSLKNLSGVESVEANHKTNMVTVVGKVDRAIVKKKVEKKKHRKVEWVSPDPQPVAVSQNAQPRTNPVEGSAALAATTTTVVVKTKVHCDDCGLKMKSFVAKYKGVKAVDVDVSENLITIKGTMDKEKMIHYLSKKFKATVEEVSRSSPAPPRAKKVYGGGEGTSKAAGGGGEGSSRSHAADAGVGRMDNPPNYGYHPGNGGYPTYNNYGYGYGAEYGQAQPNLYAPAPQMFSDENPNACSIM